jgi:hypothetical protein
MENAKSLAFIIVGVQTFKIQIQKEYRLHHHQLRYTLNGVF